MVSVWVLIHFFLLGKRPNGKGNMATKPNASDSGFEYIDAASVNYVKRGRKANLDSALVDALRNLPAGKAIALRTLQQNPAAPTYANDKARVASSIRTACKAAGLQSYRIMWSPQGVPQVVR